MSPAIVKAISGMSTSKAMRLVKDMGRDTDAADMALGVMACNAPSLYRSVMDELTRTGWF